MSKTVSYDEKTILMNSINAFMPNDIWYSQQYSGTTEILHYSEQKYLQDDITAIPKIRWNNQFTVEINNKIFILDIKLEKFIYEIKKSNYILNLQDGWADDEGIACNPIVYDNAIEILINYAQSVLKQHKAVIKVPDINLCKDGSIDLEWRSQDYIFLINVLNDSKVDVHYYGEDFKTQTIIKGFLNSTNPNDDLVFWMQKLK